MAGAGSGGSGEDIIMYKSFLFIFNVIAGGNLAAAGHPQEAGAGGAGEARHY